MNNRLDGFRGNTSLKRTNAIISFTEDQVTEYMKCAEDPIYFCSQYIKVVHIDHGLIPMKLYPYQETVLRAAKSNRRIIAKIGRQAGKSTVIAMLALHEILFKDNYNVLIAANVARTAMEIMKKILTAYEHLPKWLQQGIIEFNKSSILLENNSRIMATATTGNTARGFSFNLVILDEFAFLAKNVADDFFTSIYPTISSGKTSKIIIISTPKGMNHFYKIWNEAVEKQNDYVPIEINWWDIPGRDQAFKDEQIRNFGLEKWKQEFETVFLGSSNTLISGDTLKQLTFKSPINTVSNMQIYKSPEIGRKYFISVDPSEGKGLDYHAMTVIDITNRPFEIVAKWRDKHMPPMLVPDIVYLAAKMYNNAFVLVETKSTGLQICDILFYEKQYENMVGARSGGRNGQILTMYGKKAKGLSTSHSTKSVGCTNLKLLIETNQLILNDFDVFEELTKFVLNGSSYSADSGATDDIVMTLVNFAWATTQSYFQNLSEINMREIVEERRKELEANFIPFGYALDSSVENDEIPNYSYDEVFDKFDNGQW